MKCVYLLFKAMRINTSGFGILNIKDLYRILRFSADDWLLIAVLIAFTYNLCNLLNVLSL